jgi:antitoxin component of MazEF toxin-antitoxin module
MVEVKDMTITKLKAKNQLTIPSAIVKRLHLTQDELFAVDVEENFIKLTPVKVEPRYTPGELKAIDDIVEHERNKAKVLGPGKGFSRYIKKIAK